MKGLAELELRENQHYKEHKAKHEEQKRVFELFRQTMANEVEDIHKLQAEMAKNHSAAFTKLSGDLVETASYLKNYTDSGLTDANGRVTALSEKQEKDNQAILALIAKRVAELYKHMSDLHADSLQGIAAAQNYTEGVEVQMQKQDASLLARIQTLVGMADEMDKREKGHWNSLSNRQTAQETVEASDRAALANKIESEVSSARSDLFGQMAKDRTEVDAHLKQGIDQVTSTVGTLRSDTRARDQKFADDMTKMIDQQDANNKKQGDEIADVRNDTAVFKEHALGRLANLDSGLAHTQQSLADAKTELHKRIDDSEKQLVDKLDSGIGQLNAKAASMRKSIDDSITSLNQGLDSTKADLSSTKVELKRQRDSDVAMLQNKIDTDTTTVNNKLLDETDTQKQTLMSSLNDAMTEATKRVSDLVTELTQRRQGIQDELTQFKSMQTNTNNDVARSISDLQSDADAQKTATKQLLAALEKNLQDTNKRLEAARKQLSDAQEEQEKRLSLKLKNKFANVKDKAANDMAVQSADLNKKLQDGISALNGQIASVSAKADAAHADSMKALGAANDAQAKDTADQTEKITKLMDESKAERAAASQRIDGIRALLDQTATRLSDAKNEIDAQLKSNVQDLSGKIDDLVSRTRQQLMTLEASEEAAVKRNISSEVAHLQAQATSTTNTVKAQGKSLAGKIDEAKADQEDMDRAQDQDISDLRAKFHRNAAALEGRVAALRAEVAHQNTALSHAEADIKSIQKENKEAMTSKINSDVASMKASIASMVSTVENQAKSRLSKGSSDISDEIKSLTDLSDSSIAAVRSSLTALSKKQTEADASEKAALKVAQSKASSDTAATDTSIAAMRADLTNTQKKLAEDTATLVARLNSDKEALAARIKSTVAATEFALSEKLESDKSQIRKRLADDLLSMNKRLKQLRTDTASAASELGNQISTASTTELDHNKQQMGLLKSMDAQTASDKSSLDAMVTRMQNDLAAAHTKLAAARRSISQREKLDFDQINGKIDRGLVSLESNVTAAIDSERSTATHKINGLRDEIAAKIERVTGKTGADTKMLKSKVEKIEATAKADQNRAVKMIDDMRTKSEDDRQAMQSTFFLMSAQLNQTNAQLQAAKQHLEASEAAQADALTAHLAQSINSLKATLAQLSSKTGTSISTLQKGLRDAQSALSAAQLEIRQQQKLDKERVQSELEAGLQNASLVLGAHVDHVQGGLQQQLTTATTDVSGKVSALSQHLSTIQDSLKTAIESLKTRQETNKAALSKDLVDIESIESAGKADQSSKAAALEAEVTDLQKKLDKLRTDVQQQRLDDIAALRNKIEADITSAQSDISSNLDRQVQGAQADAQASTNKLSDKIKLVRTSVKNRGKTISDNVDALSSEAADDLQQGKTEAAEVRKAVAELSLSTSTSLGQLEGRLQRLVEKLQSARSSAQLDAQNDRNDIRNEVSARMQKVTLNISSIIAQDKITLMKRIDSEIDRLANSENSTLMFDTSSMDDIRSSISKQSRNQVLLPQKLLFSFQIPRERDSSVIFHFEADLLKRVFCTAGAYGGKSHE